MKIAIIVPMAEEAEFYRNHFHSENKEMFGSTEFEHFSVNGNDVYLGLSGIGKVQAAMNLSSLLTSVDIDVIFMTGSAGALKEDVHQEDLVLPNAFAYYDAHNTAAGNYVEGQIPQQPAQFVLDSPKRAAFANYLKKQNVAFREGLVVTGDSFIASSKQKEEIKRIFQTLYVLKWKVRPLHKLLMPLISHWLLCVQFPIMVMDQLTKILILSSRKWELRPLS